MTYSRCIAALAGLVVLALAAPLDAAPKPPDSLRVGGEQLPLAGHGTRNELLFIELYSVALYLPRDKSGPRAIEDAQVPKALRVEILYDGSLPDRIPSGWSAELMPALSQPQQQTLRRHYAQLEPRDQITIDYAPGAGTTLAINGRPVLQDKGHEIMRAFLDVWVGRTPVSEDLKRSLL